MADSFRWCDNVVQDFSTLKFVRKVSQVWLAKRRDSYYAVCGEDLFRWFSIKIYWLCDLNIRDQTQRKKPARTEPKDLIYYEALSTRWVRKGKNPGVDPPFLTLAVWFCDITSLSKKNFHSKHHLNSHGYYWPDHSNLNLLFQTRLKAMLGPWSGQIKTHHPPSPPVGLNNCLNLRVEETERQSDHKTVAKRKEAVNILMKIKTKYRQRYKYELEKQSKGCPS